MAALAWHARPIWVSAILLGVAIGGIATFVWPAEYAATAVALVPGADDATMRSEVALARSDAVARGTVDAVGPARILRGLGMTGAFGSQESDAVAATRARLDADADRAPGIAHGGGLMRLVARHPDPDTAVAMLNGAIAADQAIRGQTHDTPRATWLIPQLDAAERDVADTLAREAQLRAASDVVDIGPDTAAASAAAAALGQKGRDIAQRRAGIAAGLGYVATALRTTPARVFDSHDVTSRDGGEDARALLLRLQLDRTHMTEQYAPGWPGLAELDSKIETVQVALRSEPRSTISVTRDIRNPAFDALNAQQSSLQATDAALAREAEEVARQAGPLAARMAVLRDTAARLGVLQQHQAVQEAQLHQLSATVADLRAQDAFAAAGLDQLRVVEPARASRSVSDEAIPLAAGAAAGLLGGIGASVYAARRRRTYVVAPEAERHLGLASLGRIDLDRRGTMRAAVEGVAAHLVAAIETLAAPVATIHLVGTADRDGAELIASLLAGAIADIGGMRVLLLMAAGEDDSDARLGSGRKALAVAAEHPTLRLAGSGTTRDVILMASRHGIPPTSVREISSLADFSVPVVRARVAGAASVARLQDDLIMCGADIPGFVFTTRRFTLADRAA